MWFLKFFRVEVTNVGFKDFFMKSVAKGKAVLL